MLQGHGLVVRDTQFIGVVDKVHQDDGRLFRGLYHHSRIKRRRVRIDGVDGIALGQALDGRQDDDLGFGQVEDCKEICGP
jgi:hypothetical protein